MHNIIKAFSALVIISLLCGCGSKITIDTIDKSYSDTNAVVNAKIPQIHGIPGTEFENKINEEYINTTSSLLASFSAAAKDTSEQSVFDMTTTQYYNQSGFISIVTQYDYYARKSHKSSYRISKNIDTASCVEVSLSDLFQDDGYIDAVNKLLENKVCEEREKYSDLWAKPKLSQNQQYYTDGENLVICYPPYELSYYERGFVEIPVPIEELLTFMKDNYREQFQ